MDACITVLVIIGSIFVVIGLLVLWNHYSSKKPNSRTDSSGPGPHEHRPDEISPNIRGNNEIETNTTASVYVLSAPPSYEDLFGPQIGVPAYDSINVQKVTVVQVTESPGALVMAVWICRYTMPHGKYWTVRRRYTPHRCILNYRQHDFA